jgi:hypothetical protein
MALDVSGVATGQVIQAAHVYQYFNLLTGVMTDQAVSLKNQLTVGGSQGTGAVPLTVNGVSGQTADFFDCTAFGGAAGGVFKIPVSGNVTFGLGLTVTTNGITVTAGGITVSNGGITITAGGEVITAGGLQVTAGGVAIGGASSGARFGAYVTGTLTATGANAAGVWVDATATAGANADVLAGLIVNPVFAPGAFTGTSMYGIAVGTNSVAQASASKYGIQVGAQTGANTNNYGVYINAPSGASGQNVGAYINGGIIVSGSPTGIAATIGLTSVTAANGGGATPTLGSIGGSGPSSAGQVGWLKIFNGVTATWIPIWT